MASMADPIDAPELPPWSLAELDGVAATPSYVVDAPRRDTLVAIVEAALQRALALPCRATLLEEPPCRIVATLHEARSEARDGASLGLAIAHAHARPSPLLADPYDGTAFEVALALRDRGATLSHLVSGLPNRPLRSRATVARLWQLARFAYELRRATGLEARSLALRGGGAAGAPGRRRRRDGNALGAAWEAVAHGLSQAFTAYGLPLDTLWVDLGPPGHRQSVALVTTAITRGAGWESTLLCDAPPDALRATVAGADLLGGRAGAAPHRLVSTVAPELGTLPRIVAHPAPLPRRIALPACPARPSPAVPLAVAADQQSQRGPHQGGIELGAIE